MFWSRVKRRTCVVMIFSGIKLSNDRSHRGVSSHRKFDANGRPELKITVESQSSWETYCRAPSEPDRPTLLSTLWTQQQTQYKLHINYLNTCHSDLTASINKETVKLTVNSPTESQFQAQWVNLTCTVWSSLMIIRDLFINSHRSLRWRIKSCSGAAETESSTCRDCTKC